MKKTITVCLLIIAAMLLSACGEIQTIEPAAPGIYVLLQRSDVYTVGISTNEDSLGFASADGSPLAADRSMILLDDVPRRIEEREQFVYTVHAYGKDYALIAEKQFVYRQGDGDVVITIAADGNVSGGTPVPELALNADFLSADTVPSEGLPVLREAGTSYPALFLIKADSRISDPELWSLESEISSEGELIIHRSNRIDAFTGSTDALYVSTEIGEYIPVRGISFSDAFGIVHNYYLSQSGKDGSAIITEYSPA